MNTGFGRTEAVRDVAAFGMSCGLARDRKTVMASRERLEGGDRRDLASEARSWHLDCSFCPRMNAQYKEYLVN